CSWMRNCGAILIHGADSLIHGRFFSSMRAFSSSMVGAPPRALDRPPWMPCGPAHKGIHGSMGMPDGRAPPGRAVHEACDVLRRPDPLLRRLSPRRAQALPLKAGQHLGAEVGEFVEIIDE